MKVCACNLPSWQSDASNSALNLSENLDPLLVPLQVDQAAAGLLALGLQKGDRLGMWGPNIYEWILLQFATAKAGIILVSKTLRLMVDKSPIALNQNIQCFCRTVTVLPSDGRFLSFHFSLSVCFTSTPNTSHFHNFGMDLINKCYFSSQFLANESLVNFSQTLVPLSTQMHKVIFISVCT